MATKYEQALALSKEKNIPVPEAVAQIRNQSVTPVTTPVAPTTNVIDQMAGKTVAERQAIRSGQPAPVTTTQAPVTPTTPSGATMNADWTVTPATATPATETTPTPEPPKVETPAPITPVTPITPVVDKNAEIKAKNEAKLAENQQKAKLAEEQRQKWITEQNTALANNEWAILNTLKTGWVIPESVKTSPFYKSAQQTYNKLQQYSTYSTNELVTAINQGSIVPWTNVYNEMMKDPAMKQKLTDAQIYRAWDPVNSTQIYENASTEIMSNNPTTANYLADGVITQAEYDQATNNAQVVAKAKEVEEKANKYNTLKAEYDSIEDEVNAQFPWSPFADSIIADRQKAKYKNLVLAKWEWETATGTLTELKSQASTLFETNLNLAEKRREEQNQLLAEQRKIQAEKDMLQYKSDFEKKQAEQALNDPATQIKATMDEFAKLGIVAQGDLTSKIAEFKKSGKTLPEYITGLRQQFMSKPEYQQMLAKNKGAWVSYQTIWNKVYKIGADWSITETNISTGADESKWWVIGKNADGSDKYGFINTATSTVTPYIAPTWEATGDLRYLANQYPWQAWAKNNNPAGITWNSNFDKWTGTAKLFADAGIKFEKWTARPAKEWGNYVTFATIEDGLKAQQILMTQTYGNSTVWQMLSSWVGTSEWPNYAKQVAGMAGITDLNQKVSALSPEQVSKLQMAKIQKESPWLAKLLTQPTTTPTNANQYTDQNVNDLAYLTELQEKNPTQAAKDMKELWYTARDLANYKAGNVPLTEKQKTTSTDIISSITDLVTNYDWNDAVGKFDYTRLIWTQDAEDTNVAINNLVAKLTLPNLWVLKWPMSDKDIQFIKEASSKLSTTQSNSSFERNLIDAYNLAARRAGKPEIKKLSDISAGTQSSTVGGELDYSKYE